MLTYHEQQREQKPDRTGTEGTATKRNKTEGPEANEAQRHSTAPLEKCLFLFLKMRCIIQWWKD